MTEKIPFSDWEKIKMKVGKILKVEDHPNADKLFVLTVDVGEKDPRTIVAGLKHFCKKESLEGKSAIFIINLEPATLRGVKSDGMILAAINHDETQLCIIQPQEENIEVGSSIR